MMIDTWTKEENQELIRLIEIDPESKEFPIPNGWEVLDVDYDDFDKYVNKLSEPIGIPKNLGESTLNFEQFTYWHGEGMDSFIGYQNEASDIISQYMYYALQMGTAKFIQKKKQP